MLDNTSLYASESEISFWTWDEKYRYYKNDGTTDERTIDDTHKRVIKGVYAKDKYRDIYAPKAFGLMQNFVWCPAGRIHAGMGTDKRVTSINCYANDTIQDSMTTEKGKPGVGILEAFNISMLSQQMGGGIGQDFSTLRPDGAIVVRTGSASTGPLPFMETFDAGCATIKSSGHRRGALMGTLRIDHPDIIKYIHYKQEAGRLTNFNISILVTDMFMDAVKHDKDFDLVFPVPRADRNHVDQYHNEDGVLVYVYDRVKARYLWDLITKSTFDYAEPGVIFIDQINKRNNLWYCETIATTNPCFTGDTKVWTDKGPISFKKLAKTGKSVKVLTQLDNGQLAYRTMKNPRLTKEDAELIEITLRGSNKAKTITKIKCTPNHKIYLNDDEYDWSYAKDLIPGDSVASVYRNKANSKGMFRLRNSYEGVLEHHVAAEAVHGRRPEWPYEHGHHKNNKRKDNRVGNIEIKDASLHISEHMRGDNNPMRRFPEKNPFLSLDVSGKNNARYKHDIKIKDVMRLYREGYSNEEIGEQLGCGKYAVANRIKAYKEQRANNHTVIKVRKLKVRKDVYCGTVPATGKFFIEVGPNEGVLVSNCGEQPLPPNGACNLGAINLAKLVKNVFTNTAEFDFTTFEYAIHNAVRFLDNVLDTSLFPTKEQKKEAERKRRIGLGVTGLGNALQFMKLVYGSKESVPIIEQIMSNLSHESFRASIELARERGPFPLFDKDKYLKGEYIKTLPEDIKEGIAEHGIRNGVLNTIAPTGTTSMYYENISSGLEPTVARLFKRKTREADGSYKEFKNVSDYGYLKFREITGHQHGDPLPDYMCSALEAPLVTVDQHLLVQSTCQKYIDSSISKTINCPKDIKFEDFQDVYTKAYYSGCKGCTTYKPSEIRGSVISVDEKTETKHSEVHVEPRPDELKGSTYKIKYPGISHAFYVTINDYIDSNGVQRPFEIFVNTKSVQSMEWMTALTRMISAVFRRGGDVTFIIEELQQVFSPQGGAFVNKKYVPSLAALIGTTIERHFYNIGLLKGDQKIVESDASSSVIEKSTPFGETCPECQAPTLTRIEGCNKCLSCGHSDCG